jgi:mono/diheme cytochrome c family protein
VNLGQPEGAAVPPPITAAQVLQALLNPDGFPEVTALENPVEPSAASLARGQQVYDRACSPCHGLTGAGEGPVGQVAGVFARSLLVPETIALTDGYLYSIIRVGRGAMPQYGHQITHFDRWHVVNYVRQLQGM